MRTYASTKPIKLAIRSNVVAQGEGPGHGLVLLADAREAIVVEAAQHELVAALVETIDSFGTSSAVTAKATWPATLPARTFVFVYWWLRTS